MSKGCVTRVEIVRAIEEAMDHDDWTLSRIAGVTECVLEIIMGAVAAGKEVKIQEFGKFERLDKKERRGRNPHTGEDLLLPPRRVVKFRPSSVLQERVDSAMERRR